MSQLLPFRPAHALAVVPEERRWLIEGLWAAQAVGIVGGEPKCCKSFLALDMAVAVAASVPCLGRFSPAASGRVLLFAAEDALHIVRRRLEGIALAAGTSLDALDIQVITASVLRLDLAEDRDRLAQTVEHLRPRLLILDPFVRLHRIDENVSGEVAPLLAFLRELQRRLAVAVVLVHHARKGASKARAGQALRGSSEFHAWGDSNLYLRRTGDDLVLTVEHRAAPSFGGLHVALKNDGDALALRVIEAPATPEKPPATSAVEKIERALADAATPLSLAPSAPPATSATRAPATLSPPLPPRAAFARPPPATSSPQGSRFPIPLPVDPYNVREPVSGIPSFSRLSVPSKSEIVLSSAERSPWGGGRYKDRRVPLPGRGNRSSAKQVSYDALRASMTKSKLDVFPQRYLPTILLLAVLPRLGLAWFEHGVNHPDEIFQVLEPAHRWVYGYGIQAWEFQDGVRSWLLPGLLALFWKALAVLGVSDPLTIVPLLRLPFVALATYSAYLASRLAKVIAGDIAGSLAALLTAFTPLALILDFRTTTEAASCPVVLLVLVSLIEKKLVHAGMWMALLVFLRPTNGVVGIGLVASLLLDKRFRDTCRLMIGAVPVIAAGGLLDWVTWGSPFHHLVEYVRFNWIESGADIFGVATVWSYGSILISTAPLLAFLVLPAAITLLRAARQARELVVVASIYLLALSAVGHKEARFLLPILPLLCTITAAGLVLLVRPWLLRYAVAPHARMPILVMGTVAIIMFGALRARDLTFADVRDPRGEPQDHILFGKRDSVDHLLVEAGQRSDLCGMLILGLMPNEMFSGGMTYLNRDVLLTSPATRQLWLLMSQAANYAVAASSASPMGWQRVAERNDVALLRRSGGCISIPERYRPKAVRPTSPAK